MQCVIYISNKSQYLKNEERYGKTIDGVPLSFHEFFQIRQTQFSFHIHFKFYRKLIKMSLSLRSGNQTCSLLHDLRSIYIC